MLAQRQLEEKTGCSLGIVSKVSKELTDLGYIENGDITNFGVDALELYFVKHAVFIAAGFSSRMESITFNTSKPIVRVHCLHIIDHIIDACLCAGINKIYIVHEYLAEQFDQLLYNYSIQTAVCRTD